MNAIAAAISDQSRESAPLHWNFMATTKIREILPDFDVIQYDDHLL